MREQSLQQFLQQAWTYTRRFRGVEDEVRCWLPLVYYRRNFFIWDRVELIGHGNLMRAGSCRIQT